ncbi:hypothetical protein N9L18_00885 [Candidatus Pacebacteria bacterium]|nr:hypothetical protein [Candidatus Paceibacterota bacterium]
MKTMLKKQLGALPKEQQEAIIKAVDENPELFDKIGKEIKAKVKSGVDKQAASMSVMMSYQDELRKIIQQ